MFERFCWYCGAIGTLNFNTLEFMGLGILLATIIICIKITCFDFLSKTHIRIVYFLLLIYALYVLSFTFEYLKLRDIFTHDPSPLHARMAIEHCSILIEKTKNIMAFASGGIGVLLRYKCGAMWKAALSCLGVYLGICLFASLLAA